MGVERGWGGGGRGEEGVGGGGDITAEAPC